MRIGKISRGIAIFMVIALMAAFAAGCSTTKDPVVLKVGTVKMYLSDFVAAYNNYYSYYASYGIYDVSTTEKLHAFQDTVMQVLQNSAVCLYQAELDGLTLTEEEEAACATAVETTIASAVKSYESSVDESVTDDAARAAAAQKLFEKVLRENDFTYDSYYDTLLQDERESAIIDKQRELIYATAEVTDEDVDAYYAKTLEEDKTAAAEDVTAFYTANSSYSYGSRIRPLYVPAGYKRVTHILVETEEIAKEVQGKIAAGGDWDELVKEYTKDTGMPDEGYYVSADIIDKYYEGFGDAAVALTEIGQMSDPVQTQGGYHIIRLEEIVEEHEVELDDELRDEIYKKLLTEEQNTLYSDALAAWTEAAPITKYDARYRYIGMASN